jgi:xanthine dehydrogenase accessory factor
VVGFLRDDGVADDLIERIHTPAGLDIGAQTPEEIALAILAEVVKLRRGAVPLSAPAEAIDPVCGMTVSTTGRLWTEHAGQRVYFCSEHCMHAFEAEPDRYAAAL